MLDDPHNKFALLLKYNAFWERVAQKVRLTPTPAPISGSIWGSSPLSIPRCIWGCNSSRIRGILGSGTVHRTPPTNKARAIVLNSSDVSGQVDRRRAVNQDQFYGKGGVGQALPYLSKN